jgi:hypothetical protein
MASIGRGAVLKIGNGEPTTETFTIIEGATNWAKGSSKADSLDTTDMQSTGSRTFIPGLKDQGEFSFDVNLAPGDVSQGKLRTAFGQTVNWEFVDQEDFETMKFSGFLTSIDGTYPLDKLTTGSFKIKISGEVTYVANT